MLTPKIYSLIAILFLLLPVITSAQRQYLVFFADKQRGDFDPVTYFDAKAIERRARLGITADDVSDWPVNENYVKQVSALVDETLPASRWFNAMAVFAGDEQIMKVAALPFVLRIEQPEETETMPAGLQNFDTTVSFSDAELLKNQIAILGVEEWKRAGYDGKGLRIAILDVGFLGADKIPAFDHIRNENRLIASCDFTKRGNSPNVYYGNGHGTQVWSCIGGKVGSLQSGLATGAEFLLAKTEKNSEKFSEELYWLAAAEWADKNGADIINSSLGYTSKRYFNWQMDGKTAFVTRAANMAAAKGILVVNAAGNEGDDGWKKIGAPADADSVLSVGGIDPETLFHTSFSSYGPTFDKRLKPNVSAFGHVMAAAAEGFTSTQGTSFSSPLVAGFAACAWQSNRNLTNMQLFHEIEKSASLYPYFDYAHGYGIPGAAHFLDKNPETAKPTFSLVESGDSITIHVFKYELAQITETDNETDEEYAYSGGSKQYLYYNIMNNKGILDRYYVIEVTQADVVTLLRTDYTQGESLNVHFSSYTLTLKF